MDKNYITYIENEITHSKICGVNGFYPILIAVWKYTGADMYFIMGVINRLEKEGRLFLLEEALKNA